MIEQIVFILVSVFAVFYASKQFLKIKRNIFLGSDINYKLNKKIGLRNMFLIAFGQKKMFKRFIPAILHLFIYIAFLFTQIELLEIFIDGIFGVHRFFANYIGALYTIIINSIEILSLLAFIATLIFLSRRNLLKLPRFHMSEMTGWPKLDGNLILYGELLLILGIFSMNSADVLLQKLDPLHFPDTGHLIISSYLGGLLFDGFSLSLLEFIERIGWWLHAIVVFGFLNYLPKSKHLHILLAFPNTYFAKQSPRGEMENMPSIMNEVKTMMGLLDDSANINDQNLEELPEFGAKDVFDLSWKNVLDAYTCTECGRCSSVCPANQTGKKLSPRKIMMDIRDRAQEIGDHLDNQSEACKKDKEQKLSPSNYDDGKSLFDYISKEELHACTTCNACVVACPVMIDPLAPILSLRRYEILTESAGPTDWIPMFNAIENGGAVWQLPDQREDWAKDYLNKNSE